MKKLIMVSCFLGLFAASCQQGSSNSAAKSHSDSAQDDEKAKEAALIFYTANAAGIQGSAPHASIDNQRDSVGATVYDIAIEDGNEDGETWVDYLEVVVMHNGPVIRITHSEKDLEDASTPGDQSDHLLATRDLGRQLFDLNYGDRAGEVREGDAYEYNNDVSNRITIYAITITLPTEEEIFGKNYQVRISNNGLFITQIEEDERAVD
jgi:hypothetical protein